MFLSCLCYVSLMIGYTLSYYISFALEILVRTARCLGRDHRLGRRDLSACDYEDVLACSVHACSHPHFSLSLCLSASLSLVLSVSLPLCLSVSPSSLSSLSLYPSFCHLTSTCNRHTHTHMRSCSHMSMKHNKTRHCAAEYEQ